MVSAVSTIERRCECLIYFERRIMLIKKSTMFLPVVARVCIDWWARFGKGSSYRTDPDQLMDGEDSAPCCMNGSMGIIQQGSSVSYIVDSFA